MLNMTKLIFTTTLSTLIVTGSAWAQAPAPDAKTTKPIRPSGKSHEMIIFKAPDNRILETPLSLASSLVGFHLPKSGTDDKGVKRAIDRTKQVVQTHIPQKVGGAPCSMDYLTLRVTTNGDKRVATLTGTHAACKKTVENKGTVVACTDRPGAYTIIWAGDTKASGTCPKIDG